MGAKMKIPFTIEDCKNMAECYSEMGSDLAKAKQTFLEKYGVMPAEDVLCKAIKEFGKKSSSTVSAISKNDEEIIIKIEVPEETSNDNAADEQPLTFFKQDTLNVGNDWVIGGKMSKENPPAFNSYRIPIVYTTKLDKMLIFNKNFKSLDVNDIVENIIHESKPKFRQLPLQNNIRNINRYLKLLADIQHFNRLAKNHSKNKITTQSSINPNEIKINLDKIKTNHNCIPDLRKELRVVLRDCRLKPGDTAKVRKLCGVYVITRILHPTRKIKNPTFVAFQNKRSGITDMYCLTSTMGSCIYSRFDTPLPDDKMRFIGNVIEYCCWFDRERNLGKLCRAPLFERYNALLRTPHDCPTGSCVCCCNETSNEISLQNETEITKSEEKTPQWIQNLFSETNDENNPIVKALKYNRKSANDIAINTISQLGSETTNESLHVIINDTGKKMIHLYVIDESGRINTHLEMDPSDYRVMNEKDIITHRFNTITYAACCWLTRDRLMQTMRKHHPSTSINFIQTSHECNPVHGMKCKCCCDPHSHSTTINPTLELVRKSTSRLPLNLVHAKTYINKTFSHRKRFSKKNKTTRVANASLVLKKIVRVNTQPTELVGLPISLLQEPATSSSSQSQTDISLNWQTWPMTDGTSPRPSPSTQNLRPVRIRNLPQIPSLVENNSTTPQPPSLNRNNRTTPQPQSLIHNNRTTPQPPSLNRNNPTTPQPSLLIQNNPTTYQPPSLIQNNPTTSQPPPLILMNPTNINHGDTLPITTDTENQDPTVNSLVQSILHRFRDVRLTITPDGDVSAEVNTPIDKLSKAELKILSAILSHAKEQVKNLKHLSPGVITSGSLMNTGVQGTLSQNVQNPTPTSVTKQVLPKEKSSGTTSCLGASKPVSIYQCFTNVIAQKSQIYLMSCQSFLEKKRQSAPKNNVNTFKNNVTTEQRVARAKKLRAMKRGLPSTPTMSKKCKTESIITPPDFVSSGPSTSTPVLVDGATSPMQTDETKPVLSLQKIVSAHIDPQSFNSHFQTSEVGQTSSLVVIDNEWSVDLPPDPLGDDTFPCVQIGPAFSLKNTEDLCEDKNDCVLGV